MRLHHRRGDLPLRARSTCIAAAIALALASSTCSSARATTPNGADALWWGGFALPGTDATVYAMTRLDSSLVVVGPFTKLGGIDVNHVAQWDGSGWRKLGGGVPEAIYAATVHDGQLVAGGYRWDGTAWQLLGAGVHGVRALAVYNGELIAGGTFTQIGTTPVNHVARWDGTSWRPMGLGMTDAVRTLTVYGGELVAGGEFTNAGGIAAQHVARWNGTEWRPLGAGTSGPVYALLAHGTQLVVGGSFSNAGDSSAKNVARWDGSNWSRMGSGRSNTVLALAEHAGGVVAGSVSVDAALWDGSSWVAFSPALRNVRSLQEYGGELIAGGTFGEVDGLELDNLARWDGSSWQPLFARGLGGGPGIVTLALNALAMYGGRVVAAGEFARAGGVACSRIAEWDGSAWRPMGSGFDSPVEALAVHAGALYAGGSFTQSGSVTTLRLARWDGSSWAAVGLGLNAPVRALLSFGGDLVVGGDFVVAGNTNANRIARWNGSAWSAYGLGMDAPVRALAVYRDTLVAGGSFLWASGNPVSGVARWDGDEWQPLGQGPGALYALASYGGKLVAGGSFDHVGSVAARGVARWNGLAWSAFDARAGGTVSALAVSGLDLFVGGALDLDGASAGGVLRWNGSGWSLLGSGLAATSGTGGTAQAFLPHAGGLYVGGRFAIAGGKASSYIARWDLTATPVEVQDLEATAAANGVRLAWSLAPDAVRALAGVRVQRASAADGPYAALGDAPLAPAPRMGFEDATVTPGRTHWYRLILVDRDGSERPVGTVRITAFAGGSRTALLDATQPRGGGPATIRFVLGREGMPYHISLYDVRGRQVRELARGRGRAGEHVRTWDLRDESGTTMGRGIYFVRFEAEASSGTRKLLVLHR